MKTEAVAMQLKPVSIRRTERTQATQLAQHSVRNARIDTASILAFVAESHLRHNSTRLNTWV